MTTLRQEWASLGEIAGMRLPELPVTKQGVQLVAKAHDWLRAEWRNVRWRKRDGHGGGWEYHFTLLPLAAQVEWVRRHGVLSLEQEEAADRADHPFAADWTRFARRSDAQRAVALQRLQVLSDLMALEATGIPKAMARQQVIDAHKVRRSTLYRWRDTVRGIPRQDWLPFLAPEHEGSVRRAVCDDDAWGFWCRDYLRAEKPSAEACYRRLQGVAAREGWAVPSVRTLLRRTASDIAAPVRVRRREGEAAVKRMFPAQERDRGVFTALQAVNADGHRIDVFVRWGQAIVRPTLLVFQDLFSGLILSWRADVSENKELVRLAYGDLVERWGVPERAYLDNGRGFASKWITGGAERRNRFKVKQDEIEGVMTQLGTRPIFVTPYSGQSKPIERAFRDMADAISKDPRFAGAYVGNNPTAKPHNYGQAAVPLDLFLRVVEEGIAEHNDRVGRDTRACGRALSFRQAFDASYVTTVPRRVTEQQRRLFLMAGEYVTARPPEAALHVQGNRYHAEFLWQQMGERLQVRFDPQALHRPLWVYTRDGNFLGEAPCIAAVGFDNVEAAQEHSRRRKAFLRATRAADEAAAGMAMSQVQKLLDQAATVQAPAPETRVVRLVRGGTVRQVAVAARIEALDDDVPEAERDFSAGMRLWREGQVGIERIVADDGDE